MKANEAIIANSTMSTADIVIPLNTATQASYPPNSLILYGTIEHHCTML
jgi:hypothetical protein